MPDPSFIGILLLLRALATGGLLQQVGPEQPDTPFNHGSFRFAPQARMVLHDLWDESIAAGQERVACIHGYRYAGAFYVTRAERVAFLEADSLHLTADPASCAPPAWDGTVHTHVARFNGLPFVTFSGADRALMTWWRQKWNAEGAFCVVFSETQAYCELAERLSGDVVYSSRDPIEKMYYASRRRQPSGD
jgi:hypothetical protein